MSKITVGTVETATGVPVEFPGGMSVAGSDLGGSEGVSIVGNAADSRLLAAADGVLLVGNAADKRELAGSGGAERMGFLHGSNGASERTVASKLSEWLSPKDFGGVGDGVSNDTSALLLAAASGKNIHIDGDYLLTDTRIQLDDGQTWFGSGSIRQFLGSTPAAPSNPSAYYGSSANPVFFINSDATVDGIHIYPLIGEGVAIVAPFATVRNCTIDGEGNTWYDGINVYASDATITNNRIYDCGQWLDGIAYAQRGEGIFLSGAPFSRAIVNGNQCRGNGKNGIFIIGFTNSVISSNVFHANRMSAVQLAFLSGLSSNCYNLNIVCNVGYDNGADGFDCNNSSGTDSIHVDSIVSNNNFSNNGWIYPSRSEQISRTGTKQETLDGGSATIINVVGLTYSNNFLTRNRRALAYISACSHIAFIGNQCYKDSSADEDDTDGIRLVDSPDCAILGNKIYVPKTAMRLEGYCGRTTIANNNLISTTSGSSAITCPTGLLGITFKGNSVYIVSGDFIQNCQFSFSGCTFVASIGGNMFFYSTWPYNLEFYGNTFELGNGSISFNNCANVKLIGGSITANSESMIGAVSLIDCTGVCRLVDFRIMQSGPTAALLFSGASTSGSAYIQGVSVSGNAGGNSIRVNSSVTSALNIFLNAYSNEQGFTDYGSATVKAATYA